MDGKTLTECEEVEPHVLVEKAIEDSSQTSHKSKDAWFEVTMAVAHMSKIMYCGSEKPIDFDALSRVNM